MRRRTRLLSGSTSTMRQRTHQIPDTLTGGRGIGSVPLMRWLALPVLLACLPTRASASEEDPWFGRDKKLHFVVSAGLATGGYALGAIFWEEPSARLASGATLALGAGVAKELADLAGYGHPSWRDLAWDVIGTGAGLLLAWGADELFFSVEGGGSAGESRRMLSLGGRF